MSDGTLDAIGRALDASAEADDALWEAARILVAEDGIVWAGIAFLDEGATMLGPAAGEPDEARRTTTPITYGGVTVGELWVDGDAPAGLLERVAGRLGAHVLVGWDTGGEAWEP